MKLFLEKES